MIGNQKKWTFQWKEILISALIILASQLMVSYIPIQHPNITRLSIILLGIFLFLLTSNLKRSDSLRANAVLLIVIFGIVSCILKPIQFGLDEESHLKQTLIISSNPLFIKENVDIPDLQTIYNYDILRNPQNYKGKDNFFKEIHRDSNASGKTVSLTTISLIPSALGWKIGSLISNKIFVSYYLGRIFNILFYSLLVFFAFTISKNYKKVIFLFATWPSTIWLCAGYHYDSLYFGTSLILLALLTNFLDEDYKVTIKDSILFVSLSFLFSFSKFPFILFGSTVLFLPKGKFKLKNGRLFTLILFVVECIFSVGYYLNGTIIKTIFNVNVTEKQIDNGSSVMFFLKHPLPIVRTAMDFFHSSINSFTNDLPYSIASSNMLISASMILFFLLLFLLTAINSVKMNKILKIYTTTLYFFIIILIIYAISGDYRVFTIGNLNVPGVQGRYYYLIIATFPIIFSEYLKKLMESHFSSPINDDNITTFMQYSVVFLNVLTLGIALYTQIPHKL